MAQFKETDSTGGTFNSVDTTQEFDADRIIGRGGRTTAQIAKEGVEPEREMPQQEPIHDYTTGQSAMLNGSGRKYAPVHDVFWDSEVQALLTPLDQQRLAQYMTGRDKNGRAYSYKEFEAFMADCVIRADRADYNARMTQLAIDTERAKHQERRPLYTLEDTVKNALPSLTAQEKINFNWQDHVSAIERQQIIEYFGGDEEKANQAANNMVRGYGRSSNEEMNHLLYDQNLSRDKVEDYYRKAKLKGDLNINALERLDDQYSKLTGQGKYQHYNPIQDQTLQSLTDTILSQSDIAEYMDMLGDLSPETEDMVRYRVKEIVKQMRFDPNNPSNFNDVAYNPFLRRSIKSFLSSLYSITDTEHEIVGQLEDDFDVGDIYNAIFQFKGQHPNETPNVAEIQNMLEMKVR